MRMVWCLLRRTLCTRRIRSSEEVQYALFVFETKSEIGAGTSNNGENEVTMQCES